MSKTIFLIFLLSFFSLSINASNDEKYKSIMQNLYGENKEITGDYDKSLSITCNNGIFVGKKKEDILSFKGIPFAKPPVDDLRWKAPILAEDSNKIYEAYYFGKAPIQGKNTMQLGAYYPQSEDCLYLNIWLNTKDTSKNKPVMVYIHGGAFNSEATSDPLLDGHNLVSKYPDIILVTVEYRLSLLGFIDLSIVPGGENYKDSINLGLLDQICSLKWIQKNIKNFGGDPEKVTLFGNSAGGSSIAFLTLMDESQGLFKRIIDESGPLTLTSTKDEFQKLTNQLLSKFDAKNMEDLMSISEEDFYDIILDVSSNYPLRDGTALPLDLYEAFKSGKGKDVDMLIGSNQNETMFYYFYMNELYFRIGFQVMYENNLKKMSKEDQKKAQKFMKLLKGKKLWKVVEFYNEMVFRLPLIKQAEYHSDNGGNTYVYYWKYDGEQPYGAYHSLEIPYVFNNFKNTIFENTIKENENIIKNVQDMWVNFARTGNPSTKELVWDKYDSKDRKTMIIDEKCEMINDYKGEQREILDSLLKYNLKGDTSNLSYNVPIVYQVIGQVVIVLLVIIGAIILLKNLF